MRFRRSLSGARAISIAAVLRFTYPETDGVSSATLNQVGRNSASSFALGRRLPIQGACTVAERSSTWIVSVPSRGAALGAGLQGDGLHASVSVTVSAIPRHLETVRRPVPRPEGRRGARRPQASGGSDG